MKQPDRKKVAIALLACLSWMLPAGLTHAESPAGARPAAATAIEVHDVALDANGRLHGQLVDAQAQPVPQTRIEVLQSGRTIAVGMSDDHGDFQATLPRGGLYQVQAAGGQTLCRCWAANTAPPAAGQRLLVVSSQDVQRGQQPIKNLLFSKPLLLGGIIAAAVAIPVAIHNHAKSNKPPSS